MQLISCFYLLSQLDKLVQLERVVHEISSQMHNLGQRRKIKILEITGIKTELVSCLICIDKLH